MADINIFDTYVLRAIMQEVVPKASFFKDRYAPTDAGDIFSTNKVLTEYKDGDRKLAAFVERRSGDIPVDRIGYAIHEYEPAYIAPSRVLTVDVLRERGFGEAIYSDSTEAERAAKIIRDDFADLDARITRREEWMAAQTLINNAVTIQNYVDAATTGTTDVIQFYDTTPSHTYTVSAKWNATGGDFFSDVRAMCRALSQRGLPATDLILGADAADVVLGLEGVQKLLDKNSGIIVGTVEQELTQYDGVSFLGNLNFRGYHLNVFCVDHQYVDESGTATAYFPAKGACVTAPGCMRMAYGAVTQINYGDTEFSTTAGTRVPKLEVNQGADMRKVRVASRPLCIPVNKDPFIYAANAVN